MKKLLVGVLAVALVVTIGIEVYAWRGGHGRGNHGGPGWMHGGGGYGGPGWMMQGGGYGPGWMKQGGNYGGPGWMHGGPGWNNRAVSPDGNTGWVCPGWSQRNSGQVQPGTPGTPGTAWEMISEEKAKEVAGAFVQQSLPGYTVESITKDQWRPLYFATAKGENDAVLNLVIHGFSGQVMNVFPQVAE